MAEQRARITGRTIGVLASATMLATSVLVGASSAPVSAATYTVVNTDNSGAGSLRDAVTQANANAGEDTIRFEFPTPATISLTNDISIVDDLRIEGPGQTELTITGPTRVFDVDAGSLHLESLTIDGVGPTDGRSALIFGSNGALSLDEVTISGATKHALEIDLASSVTILNSNLSGNAGDGVNAEDVVGEIRIENSELSDNNENLKLLNIGGTVTFKNSSSTRAVDDGGDIRDSGGVVVTSSRFDSNGDHFSILRSTGPVSITDSSFENNLSDDGVSIQNITGGITVTRSTFAGNPRSGLTASGSTAATQVTVINSTFSGNGTSGIVLDAGASANLRHSTFAANTGKGVNVNGGNANITHSIIADNAGGAFRQTLGGTLSVEYSLLPTGENPGGTGNVETADAKLGALVNNGGPTRTHLLQADSPAVNAGNPAITVAPDVDQRGSTRVVGVIDIGSVERQATSANAGEVSIAPATTTVPESAGTIQLNVERFGGTDGEVSVRVRSQNGTASSPGDYASIDQVVTFAAGESGKKAVDVTIVNDTIPEVDQTFKVLLSEATGGVSVVNGAADVTIDDDDPAVGGAGTISITPTTATVSEAAGSATFMINRSGGSNGSIAVRVTTQDVTTEGDDDFVPISRTVTFGDGDTAPKSVTLDLVDDDVNEADESLTIRTSVLSGGAALGESIATVTITDDDDDGVPALDVELDMAGRFVPLAPQRLFDTRPTEPGNGPKGKLAAEQTIDVQITGVAGVPADATAVVMNVTMTQSEGPGFVTAWATGSARPETSNLNYIAPGQTRPNLVTVPIGAGGRVSLYALSPAHLLGDIAGYYVDTDSAVSAGRVVSLSPTRLFDTRPTEPGDGPKGLIPADTSIDVPVLGQANVPATGVAAVVMNLTATDSSDLGFVTAHPTDQQRPTASVLNMSGPGQTVPNLVIVPVGADGKVRFYTLNATHLLGDVMGYVTDESAAASTAGLFVPLAPNRVFDSRPEQAAPGPKGFVAGNSEVDVQVGGVGNIPADASAVVMNITATAAENLGFVTGWPAGQTRPTASLLNLAGPGDTRPNATILPLGEDAEISLYTLNGTHLLADSFGYYLG